MNLVKGAFFGAVGAAGVAAASSVLAARSRERQLASDPRWHVLTVHKALDEMRAAPLPPPLAELGEAVQIELRRAAGDKGTEIAVRLREGEPSGLSSVTARLTDQDPRRAVRRALREAKSIIETGEVLKPDTQTSTRRTVVNRPLEYASRHGREEGLL
ncbi:hypothetical protein GCM10022251_13990 [Phytohabitans flavus]|uniref:Uncharacterized protein n=1 Tax=Phytohabitans flavus TaxID=1076124 RepID=A0A6F8XIY6_9ACTN|nr:hypothetical protein [Phytohabitans flavus]BCB73775.1 hypothetical protein Pflav_001850 [Phytohabitans flavus]